MRELEVDTGALRLLRERFIEAGRGVGRSTVRRAIGSDEFAEHLDAEIAGDIPFAPIDFRLRMQHQPIDDDLVDEWPRAALLSLPASGEQR